MKAVMYHYVRPYNPEYPNFKNLHIDDFIKQLDYFEQTFGFVSLDDFLHCFKTGEPIDGVVLTFDDGLYCHYQHVFPELKKRNLWGLFYIPTLPIAEGKLLDVHRTHLLLGKHASKSVFHFLEQIIDESLFDQNKIGEFKTFTYRTQENDQYTLLVKRILNYFIAYQYREKILDQVMHHFIPNEKEISASYYLSPSQIKAMHEEGMIIGSHTVSHPVMSRLNKAEQDLQISQSFDCLENIVGAFHHKTFCYPYGGFHSFTDETEQLLTSHNCTYSFNVEQRDIEGSDLQTRPQALPRYDCNQFKYGKVRKQ